MLITAKDANGTRDTENTFTLEQTVTEYIGPQALINSLNPVCIVGPYDTGTNQYELITLRYEVVWSNLIIGNTIDVTYSSSLSDQGATWSNPGDPCGVPGMPAGGGNVSNGSFVATAATQSYYIDIRFEFIYNFPPYGGYYSKENIEIASYDATGNYTGNTLTTIFTGNEALYSVVENLEQAGTPCPCIPTP